MKLPEMYLPGPKLHIPDNFSRKDAQYVVYCWMNQIIMMRLMFPKLQLNFDGIRLTELWSQGLDDNLVILVHFVVYTMKNLTPSFEKFQLSLKNCVDVPTTLLSLLQVPYQDPHLTKRCLEQYYKRVSRQFWSNIDTRAVKLLMHLKSSTYNAKEMEHG
jgi:hypothetical protein